MVITRRSGALVRSWKVKGGVRAHDFVLDEKDRPFLVDAGDHSVGKYSAKGKRKYYLGPHGKLSETGYDGGLYTAHYRDIKKAGEPYNLPTGIALSPCGKFIYITDGYGNCVIHIFDRKKKKFIRSIGSPGRGKLEFNVPHQITVDELGNLWVLDRENNRIQILRPDGTFHRQIKRLPRPNTLVHLESGYKAIALQGTTMGTFPGDSHARDGVSNMDSSVIIIDGNDEKVCEIGPGKKLFYVNHGICEDWVTGDLFVGGVRPTNPHGVDPESFPLCNRLCRLRTKNNKLYYVVH